MFMCYQLTHLDATTKHQRGAGLIEYALIVAMIAIVCVAAVSQLGGSTQEPFNDIKAPLTSTTS